MTEKAASGSYYSLTVTFTREEWKVLRQIGKRLGTVTATATASAALAEGMNLLSADLAWGRPNDIQLSMKLPRSLWIRLGALAREHGKSPKAEITAALNHWLETAETKKGEAPA
jgi:hypothetical protein